LCERRIVEEFSVKITKEASYETLVRALPFGPLPVACRSAD
jgi:hypothetical protein